MGLARRKHPRLKDYDYSQGGCYFATICTKDKKPLLSHIGRNVLGNAAVFLTPAGEIVQQVLLQLPERFPCVSLDAYVLMPTHLHVLFRFAADTVGLSPAATLMDVVRALKSLSARACNTQDNSPGRKIWQDSFYETVVRDERAYTNIWEYVEANPIKWEDDPYYCPQP